MSDKSSAKQTICDTESERHNRSAPCEPLHVSVHERVKHEAHLRGGHGDT